MKSFILLAILLAACKGPSRQAASAAADTSTPVSAGTPVAYRLPRAGGTVEVYRLPSLEPVKWTAGRVTGPRAAVGVDVVGRRLIYRDSLDQLLSYDLVASRERVIAPRGALAALGSDGTLLAVDSTGGVIESQPWGTRPWTGSLGRGVRAAFTAPGARLIAVRHTGRDSLVTATRENGVEEGRRAPTTSQAARAATRDGDAVGFATDSGVVVEELESDRPWFVRLAGHPTSLVFTPSGHRIYVALADKNELAVVDRFDQRELSAIPLPGRATGLRMDPWGRVLLVLGDGSPAPTWVVSLARGGVTGELSTEWGSDLPSVSPEAVILLREHDAIVARDLRTLDSLGAVPGAGADLWFAARSSPPPATAGLRALADSATGGRRAATPPRPRTAGTAADSAAAVKALVTIYWVQVSVSRNEQWARALADELNRDNHRARVAAPSDSTEGWRVLTGPYPSREAADSAGRALGRPYWVVDRGPGAR